MKKTNNLGTEIKAITVYNALLKIVGINKF